MFGMPLRFWVLVTGVAVILSAPWLDSMFGEELRQQILIVAYLVTIPAFLLKLYKRVRRGDSVSMIFQYQNPKIFWLFVITAVVVSLVGWVLILMEMINQ